MCARFSVVDSAEFIASQSQRVTINNDSVIEAAAQVCCRQSVARAIYIGLDMLHVASVFKSQRGAASFHMQLRCAQLNSGFGVRDALEPRGLNDSEVLEW